MKWCVYFGLYSAWHRQMSGTSTGAYNFKIRDGISELFIEWMENMIYAKANMNLAKRVDILCNQKINLYYRILYRFLKQNLYFSIMKASQQAKDYFYKMASHIKTSILTLSQYFLFRVQATSLSPQPYPGFFSLLLPIIDQSV